MNFLKICISALFLAILCHFSDCRTTSQDESWAKEETIIGFIIGILIAIWEFFVAISGWDTGSSTSLAPSTTQSYVTDPEVPCTFELNTNPAEGPCQYGEQGKYCDKCGLSFVDPNIKIVGGEPALSHSWPAIAFIVFKFNGYVDIPGIDSNYLVDKSFLCGGNLVTRDTVITAAHCINDELEIDYEFENGTTVAVAGTPIFNEAYPDAGSMYTVYLGLQNNAGIFNGEGVSAKTKVVRVRQVNKHPEFNSSNFFNDIAVLKLIEEVELNCHIQIACLPDPSVDDFPTETNVPVYAAGWGTLWSGGFLPDDLYNVKLTLYEGEKCDAAAGTPKNYTTQICAGELEGGKDTCQGDSGGPLYIKSVVQDETKFVLAGVVSYGEGCALPNTPGIYTRVSAFLDWLNPFIVEP